MYVKVILHHHHHPPPTTKTIITLPVGLLPEVEIWLRKGKTHLSSMWCSQPQMGPKTFVPYCWKQTTPPWCPLLFHLGKIPGKQKYLRLPLNHETGAEREWDIFGHRKYKNGIRQFFLVVTSVLLNCLSVCLFVEGPLSVITILVLELMDSKSLCSVKSHESLMPCNAVNHGPGLTHLRDLECSSAVRFNWADHDLWAGLTVRLFLGYFCGQRSWVTIKWF